MKHAISVEDRYLAKIVRRLQDLPGYELFKYYDDDGELCSVGSMDVNDYLREISGDDFTAKDFRTWAGTLLAVRALVRCPFTTGAQAKRNIKKAILEVAERLGNTVAVCRKCYIHPAVIDAYINRSTAVLSPKAGGKGRADEATVIRVLRQSQKPKPAVSLTETLTRSIRQIKHR